MFGGHPLTWIILSSSTIAQPKDLIFDCAEDAFTYTHVRIANWLRLGLVLVPELPVLTNGLGPITTRFEIMTGTMSKWSHTLGANFGSVLTTIVLGQHAWSVLCPILLLILRQIQYQSWPDIGLTVGEVLTAIGVRVLPQYCPSTGKQGWNKTLLKYLINNYSTLN